MEEKIMDLIAEICDDDSVRENPDLDLFDEGLIDSLGLADLLYSIEENFGVVIAASEIDKAQIGTANQIISYVKEKLGK